MAHFVHQEGTIQEPASSLHVVYQGGTFTFIVEVAVTEVFFENRIDAITQGEKFQTASQLNGVLVT